MDHVTTGLRSILSSPQVYNLSQRLVTKPARRRKFVREFIGATPSARILDIGCGTGTFLEDLPAGVGYVGYDMEPRYIEYASRRYKDRGVFHCRRVSEQEVREGEKFDIVLALGILHHLNNEEALQLFGLAAESLKTGGHLVTLDPTYCDGQSRMARYIISRDRGQNVRTPEEYVQLAERAFSRVETEILRKMIKIPYSHFAMKCVKG